MKEQRIGPGLIRMTEGGIKGAAAVEIVIPGHRVVVAVSATGVGRLIDFDEEEPLRPMRKDEMLNDCQRDEAA